MMRKTLVTLICLTAVLSGVAQAADPMKTALSFIPEDAVGFVCVPELKGIDGKLQQTIGNLGLQPFVPPPYNSPLALLQQFLQMTEGLDENGPVALVQMPFDTPFEQSSRMAFIFPAEKPKALLEAMGGQVGEGGNWSLALFGQPSVAAIGEKRVIVAMVPDVLKAVTDSKGGMDGRFKGKDLKVFKGLDLVLWIDGERLLGTFKPQIDGFMGMMLMMQQASSSPFGAAQGETTKKQIDMFMEGAKWITLGVSLDPAGIGLRGVFHAKAGSELARVIKATPAKDSLLQGLPAGKFMIAGGQVFETDELKDAVKNMEPYFEAGEGIESVDADQLKTLKNILEDWAPTNKGLRFTLEALPPGPGGVVGMAAVVETSDSGRWLELAGRAIEALKKLSTDEDAQMLAKATSFTSEAEEIGGVKVTHLKLDLSKIEDLDEDDLDEITTVLGKEAVLLRMAAVGPNVVAVGFGGGADYMKRLIEHADKKAAPLEGTPGIEKVAGHLPKKQVGVAYVAVDQIFRCVQSVLKALEEEELPVDIPEINAPLALASTTGDDMVRVDAFFPTELVVTAKNLVMTMMGMGAPAEPAEPAGAVKTGTD